MKSSDFARAWHKTVPRMKPRYEFNLILCCTRSLRKRTLALGKRVYGAVLT